MDFPSFPGQRPLESSYISLLSYDKKTLWLPRTAAMHSQYLVTVLKDDKKERDRDPVPLPHSYCVYQAVQYVASFLKLCDSMADLPGSGYCRDDQGRKLSGSHLPSIYFYLGEDTNRTAWEFARRAFMRALTDVPDSLLVQMMHTSNFLDVRSMLDSVILQLAIRIEKEPDSEVTRRIAKDGGSVLVDGLVSMSNDYVIIDEELALQFVRALTILVPLGHAEDLRVFQVLTIPEVARCHPLENEIARAIRILTTKFGHDKMLSRFVLLFDNPDWPVRRFGLRTFFSTDMSQWTPSWIETVVSRLQHGNLDRREEAFRALRKLGVPVVQNHEMPKKIRDTLMMEAMKGRGGIGDNSRRFISNEINDCFFRDDDGRMLLRDRDRWWSLIEAVLRYRAGIEEENWLEALGVEPDDPNNPFRLLLEHILPPYCQHMYAKDHCVQDLVGLIHNDDVLLRAASLLALGYACNPFDRRIKKILLAHANKEEDKDTPAAPSKQEPTAATGAVEATPGAAPPTGGEAAEGGASHKPAVVAHPGISASGSGTGEKDGVQETNVVKEEGGGDVAMADTGSSEGAGQPGKAEVSKGAQETEGKREDDPGGAHAGGGPGGAGGAGAGCKTVKDEADGSKKKGDGEESKGGCNGVTVAAGSANGDVAGGGAVEEKKGDGKAQGTQMERLVQGAAMAALEALKVCQKRWCQSCRMHMDWCHCPRCERCNQHHGSCECGDESDCSRCGMEREACECWERHEEDYDSQEDEYISDFDG